MSDDEAELTAGEQADLDRVLETFGVGNVIVGKFEPYEADDSRPPKLSALEEADAAIEEEERESRTTWQAVDLAVCLERDETDAPQMLHRSDGFALLYDGKRNELHGAYESGKSWIALVAVAELLASDDGIAVWIDFEDSPGSIASRLLAIGVPKEVLTSRRFRYIGPSEPLNVATETDLRLELLGASLVVVDAVNEAMAASGLDPNRNNEVAAWYATFPRLAVEAGAALLVLDHVAKDPANQRGAVGAGHKSAKVDASYVVETTVPFGRGSTGTIRIRLHKDRPGFVRGRYPGRLPIVAEVAVDATNPEALTFDVRPPPEAGEFRPTFYMEKVSRFLELGDEPRTAKQIEENVAGKAIFVRQAVTSLLEDGYIGEEKGPRNARLFRSIEPFRDGS